MKHLKQKLMAAVSMLMVSFLMLTSASYAWFTISVTPEVKEIKTTVQANENFEIALGTIAGAKPADTKVDDGSKTDPIAKDQTWGATVTSLTAMKGMGPATLSKLEGESAATINAAKYGTDGRPAGLAKVDYESDYTNGVMTFKDKEGHVIGQKILLWLRSNQTGAVTVEVSGVELDLTPADTTDENTNAGNKVQVAFQWKDDGAITLTGTDGAGITNGAGTIATLGTITADEPTPVYVYVYLEGGNVTNADVDKEFNVLIKSIKFSHATVDAANAYKQATLNSGGNTAPATE